jgi:hypothetical protein
MIRLVNGQPVQVPDDARVTPELATIRDGINQMLRWAQSDAPEIRRLREQYRTGLLLKSDFDWDVIGPSLPSSPEPRPLEPAPAPDAGDAGSGTGGS